MCKFPIGGVVLVRESGIVVYVHLPIVLRVSHVEEFVE